MKQWNLVLYVPAYNAEKSIGELLQRISKAARKLGAKGIRISALFVVNDGSTDSTLQELELAKTRFNLLHIVNKVQNQGAAAAVLSGMDAAVAYAKKKKLPPKSTVIARMDSDLEHQPEDLGKVLLPLLSGKALVSFGYLPLDSRNGYLASWFSRTAGLAESREFLGADAPQFAPGFHAARADIFFRLHDAMHRDAALFRKITGKEMVTIDFVFLARAKSMGLGIASSELSPIEEKWIKKIPAAKILSYAMYHYLTAAFLRNEFSRR